MRFWLTFASLFLLFRPIGADDGELVDFDDDAFLSNNSELEGTGLIGWSLFRSDDEDKYIINFNNVSVVEYIRFVSKISNKNFQFEQSELDFTITLMSEEPLSVQNILSALIQTLRARGFSVLEEQNTLFITRSKEVNQIPTIVTDKHHNEQDSPIVTRVFRVENGNLSSIASILRPMMSETAMVDILPESRQLIVTDITTNVKKICVLLQSLDTTDTTLDLDVYKVRHMNVEVLVALARQIVEPFAGDALLTMVPEPQANSVFIVSTPDLIERTIEIMEDLDKSPKDKSNPIGNKVFLYPIENKSAEELLDALEEIADELEGSGSQSISLVAALENAKWIKDTNSLLFITDPETQMKVEAILKTLDTMSDTSNFFVYKMQKAGKEQVERSLEQLAKTLKKNPKERELVEAIQSMRYIKETNSFIFTGSQGSIKKLQEILPTFDVAVAEYSPTNHFWLYTPQYLSGRELEDAVEELTDSLSSSGLTDEALLTTIESVKWVPATNTLLFTGDPQSLERIESMIKLIDVPSGAPSKIFIYKPQYISNEQIEEALDELADRLDHKNLSDRNLAAAIDNMSWIRESQTFLFKADPSSIEKIETFLKDIDNPKEAEAIAGAYFLFKLKYSRGNDVLDHLEKIGKSLPDRDPQQKAIIDVIDGATYLKDTNSILLTGSQKAVEEVKNLITQFDVPGSTPAPYEKTSFFIYKPIHLSPSELQEALQETASDLKGAGLIDPSLLQSIETMRVVEMTGSVIFTGTKESLAKTEEIISTIDVAGAGQEALGEFAGHTFFIYKVRYLSMDELMKLLNNVVNNLQKNNQGENQQLIRAIKTAKEIKETKSLLFTGQPPVLEKVAELLKQLDVPEGTEVRAAGTYVIYKPINVSGPELIDMMKDFEMNLEQSGVCEAGLFETIDNLKYIERTKHILISGDANDVQKVQELLKRFDTPGSGAVTSLTQLETSFLIYKLHYHSGDEIQQTLKKIAADLRTSDPAETSHLTKAINSIQWIKITNSLLATGSPDVLTQLKELIQNIDVPLRQVFIEVLIIQTTAFNQQLFGLQWGGKVQYLNRFAGSTSNFPVPPPVGGANRALEAPLAAVNATRTPLATDISSPSLANGGFDLGVIGDLIFHKGKTFLSLASLVNALQSDSDSVIVMNPKIIAQDSQQSNIFVGQNIPFTGSLVNTIAGTGQQTSANIEYRDVGTNLTITPMLGTNDIITLDISTEITAQAPNTTNTIDGSLQGLQTSRTSLNAKVSVPDKHFVALSGMIQDQKDHFKSGLPCLGGLPVVGALFSTNDRSDSRNNVIFFIRPVIIDSVEQFDEITENQENLFKEQGVKQIVKEEIDDAIDWVRDPCD